jgi:Tfp pilus assembly protein PilF
MSQWRSIKAKRLLAALPILLFLFLSTGDARAQSEGQVPADALYDNARNAVYAEHWEKAIELYKTGQGLYPDDIRFSWALGNLYFDRSLYGLAWDEYRRAEVVDPLDLRVLFRLARTAGYLNLSASSVDYYERILSLEPENKDAIGSLGWMYYKVHRLSDGERLLSDALDRFGDDADFAMTLGTIYSDMYNYDWGKYWYQEAIRLGEIVGDRVFTAVAHYNLSILETRFYRFDLSMDETNASLDSQVRASGYSARGELNLRQLDLKQAQSDFQSAYGIDTSPLAKLNLAQAYQISGRLDEARLYAEDCLKANEFSWMLNYGIDPDRYKRDIHEILYKTYKGLAFSESFMPWGRPGEKIFSFYRKISYRFKSAVHHTLYRKYSLAAADAYLAQFNSEGQTQDIYLEYYNAFDNYPRRAICYLNRARELETEIIPAAVPSYDLEEGLLFGNLRLIEQALAGFEPRWEREMISQCYREFALRSSGLNRAAPRSLQRSAAEELFALNRGGLRQAGISLPAEINLELNTPERGGKALHRALKKAGFAPAEAARYRLNISINGSAVQGYAVHCDLIDTRDAARTLRQTLPLRSFSTAAICDFARSLGNAVFLQQ